MKKQIWLIVLLTTMSVIGIVAKTSWAVEAPNTSKGLKGVSVEIYSNSEVDKVLTKEMMRVEVERELRRVGLAIYSENERQTQPGKPQLMVQVLLNLKSEKIGGRAYSVYVGLKQDCTLGRDAGIVTSATTWKTLSIDTVSEDAVASGAAKSSVRKVLISNVGSFVKDCFPDAISLNDGQRLGKTVFPVGSTLVGGRGQNVTGVPCAVGMSESYHIHAHLSFFVNGEQIAIPAGIGITNPVEKNAMVNEGGCLYALHTHGPAGVIHIETDKPTDFTLGQFFDIWGQPLLKNRIANYTGFVAAYVNGTRYYGDLRAIVFTPHMEITIEMGTPLVTPPVYIFPDDLF